MRRILLLCVFSIAVLLTFHDVAFAQWKKLGSFGALIRSSYFLGDAGQPNTGFVGLANNDGTGAAWRTSDGGATWKECIPNTFDATVTNFSFKDSLTGWFSSFTFGIIAGGIYKTTDGGQTWNNLLPLTGCSSIHYQASNGLLFASLWSSTTVTTSLVSSDEGTTWNSFGHIALNGFAFANDTDGIVTVLDGPHLSTRDGGRNWRLDIAHTECWQPCAMKGSFYLMNESLGDVWRSDDVGQTWKKLTNLGLLTVSGEIEGYCGYLIVQSQFGGPGFLESTDFGLTWHSIGGGCSALDSRFFMYEQNIYGGDENGDFWTYSIDLAGDTVQKQLAVKADGKQDVDSIHLGNPVMLDITLDQSSPDSLASDSLSFEIDFDKSVLTPISIAAFPGWDTLRTSAARGTINIWLKPQSNAILPLQSDLCSIRFASTLGDSERSAVMLKNLQFYGRAMSACSALSDMSNTSSVEVQLIPFCGEQELQEAMRGDLAFDIISVSPNPAMSSCAVRLDLVQQSPVEATLFDETGNKVLRSEYSLSPGEQTINLNLNGLPQGVYFLTFESFGQRETRNLLISR